MDRALRGFLGPLSERLYVCLFVRVYLIYEKFTYTIVFGSIWKIPIVVATFQIVVVVLAVVACVVRYREEGDICT